MYFDETQVNKNELIDRVGIRQKKNLKRLLK